MMAEPPTETEPSAPPAVKAPPADQPARPPAWRRIGLNLFLLTLGSVIFAVALDGILEPKRFLSGGLLGLALFIKYLFSGLPVGLVYAILNLPLIILGWFSVSRPFMLYTLTGIGIFSLAALVIDVPTFPIEDMILASILAGVIGGLGAGLSLRSAGSLGGLDILAVYLSRRWDFRVGWTYTAFNVFILTAGAIMFGLEIALYSMIYVFVSGKVIDAVITGFNRRKSVMIISDSAEEIGRQIIRQRRRGVTFLQGEGAYTGRQKKVAFTITTLTDLARMKDLIFAIDPQAFVIVNDTLEVLGDRHGARRIF